MAGGSAGGKAGSVSGEGFWAGGVASGSCPVQRSLQREQRGGDKAVPWWGWVDRNPLVATFWALGIGGQAQGEDQDNPQINDIAGKTGDPCSKPQTWKGMEGKNEVIHVPCLNPHI